MSKYSELVLSRTPVAYWRFEELSGTVATDSSGNGRTGTYVNSPVLGNESGVPGDNGSSILFNESTQRMTVADHTSLDFADDIFSIEVWLRRQAINAFQTILDKGTNGYQLQWRTPENSLALAKSGVALIVRTGAVTSTNDWNYFVFTKNSTTSRNAYMNGVDVSINIGDQDITASATTLHLGGLTAANNQPATSYVDELALYNYVLTPAQIAESYLTGIRSGLGRRRSRGRSRGR